MNAQNARKAAATFSLFLGLALCVFLPSIAQAVNPDAARVRADIAASTIAVNGESVELASAAAVKVDRCVEVGDNRLECHVRVVLSGKRTFNAVVVYRKAREAWRFASVAQEKK